MAPVESFRVDIAPNSFLSFSPSAGIDPDPFAVPSSASIVSIPIQSSLSTTAASTASSDNVVLGSSSVLASTTSAVYTAVSASSATFPSSSSLASLAGASSGPASTGSPLPAAIDSSKATSTNGLIAGLVVLGVLLLLAFVLFGLYLCRRTRQSRSHRLREAIPPQQGAKLPDSSSWQESPRSAHQAAQDSSSQAMEKTIACLETQLHEKDTQLRENRAALLLLGRRPSSTSLSDRQAYERFESLYQAIQDWVRRYIAGKSLTISPSADTLSTLKRSQPGYETLLKDAQSTQYLIGGLVADILCQAFATGQLLGNEAYEELRQTINAKASTSESNEWRALTARLLEHTSNYQTDRAESINEITQQIEDVVTDLTGSASSQQRWADMVRIVEAAAKLASDTAKQRAFFKVQMPFGTFDSRVMDAVEVENQTRDPNGRTIRAVAFPSVTRWGNEKGVGYERCVTIFKAQVLI